MYLYIDRDIVTHNNFLENNKRRFHEENKIKTLWYNFGCFQL